MWSIVKTSGRSIHPSLGDFWEWPHTITTMIGLRMRYDSYLELSEPPPEEHWDFPEIIRRHIEKLYPNIKGGSGAEISSEDIED